MKPVPKRFALFIRVSSKGQQQGESPHVQRKLGEEYVRRNAGKVVKVYDGVESGTKPLDERELLQRVLRDVHADAWDALWVLDQSRLTRSPDTLLVIAKAFKFSGLELHTTNGRMQLDTPEGELHAGIQSQSDRYMAQKIAQRTRQSRLEMLRKGQHAFGRHPWGRRYNKDLQVFEVVDRDRARIQHAYTLYVQDDLSLERVAKKVRMPKSSLAKAFASAGKTKWPRKLTTEQGVREFVLDLPALLSPVQAAAVERRRERNRTVRPGGTRERSLLQGLIRCWHCGGKLSRMPTRKGGAADYPVYRHLPSTRKAECLWHVPAKLIEDDVVHGCAEIVRDDKKLMAAISAEMAAQKAGLNDAQSRLRDLEKDRTELCRRLDRAQSELLRSDGSNVACIRLRNEMAKLSTQISDLDIEQRDLREKVDVLNTPLGNPKEIADRLRRMVGARGAASLTLTPQQKRALVVLVVGRDKESSPNGIFVRMSRARGSRTGIWYWQLKGALAIGEGGNSHYAEQVSSPTVRQKKVPEPGAIRKLAELTRTFAPLREDTVRSSPSSSVGV